MNRNKNADECKYKPEDELELKIGHKLNGIKKSVKAYEVIN